MIGDNSEINASACIQNGTRMGEGCKVFPGAIIGSIPQDLKYKGEDTILEIGNNVIIREYCTINKGTNASGKTVLGDDCLIMAYVHVAHDCIIGANSILANCVNLAGHIEVGEKSILGGMTAVHQFVRIGAHAMVSGGSLVRKDVPPYIKAAREPLSYTGVNSIGLRRRGFSEEQIHRIQDIYRLLYVSGLNTTQAVKEIEATFASSEERDNILNFIRSADRGIIRGLRHLYANRTNGNSSK